MTELPKIRKVAEKLDWKVEKVGKWLEISKYSGAGEDFRFCVEKPYIKSIKEYAEDFDVDEHIEMWVEAKQNGVRGVPSVRELVHDAEEIKADLLNFAGELDGNYAN